MIVLDYSSANHQLIMHALNLALKQGKVIAYPTDTSYGLGVDASNLKAVQMLYKVKGRSFNKAVSVVVPSKQYLSKLVKMSTQAKKLVDKFWPGALTIVLPVKKRDALAKVLTAGNFELGCRLPDHDIAQQLARDLGKPITATSANVSGLPDCYSAKQIMEQYQNQVLKPDIILSVGKIGKRPPSTVVRAVNQSFEILRKGPITKAQIRSIIDKL